MRRRFYAIPITEPEHEALQRLAKRNRVTMGEMLRGLMIDALYEEGLLGRIGQAGHPQVTESREAGGASQQ